MDFYYEVDFRKEVTRKVPYKSQVLPDKSLSLAIHQGLALFHTSAQREVQVTS